MDCGEMKGDVILGVKVVMKLTEKNKKALNKVTKSHTMLAQDSFLGSLLLLPVELWNGIAG